MMNRVVVTKLIATVCIAFSSAIFSSDIQSGDAEATGSTQGNSQAENNASTSKDEMVCRMEKPLGSNMKKRVCRAKDQVAKEEEASHKEVSNNQKQ